MEYHSSNFHKHDCDVLCCSVALFYLRFRIQFFSSYCYVCIIVFLTLVLKHWCSRNIDASSWRIVGQLFDYHRARISLKVFLCQFDVNVHKLHSCSTNTRLIRNVIPVLNEITFSAFAKNEGAAKKSFRRRRKLNVSQVPGKSRSWFVSFLDSMNLNEETRLFYKTRAAVRWISNGIILSPKSVCICVVVRIKMGVLTWCVNVRAEMCVSCGGVRVYSS